MAHEEHNPGSPEAIELGYEPETIRVRGLLIFLICFVATGVVLHALLWWLMKGFSYRESAADAPRSILSSDHQPPPPDLQPSVGHDALPYQDLAALRHREDVMFSKMGWRVDMETHEVQIPADVLTRVAEEARTRAASPAIPPTTTGKESNSIVAGPPPAYDTQPNVKGGQRP